MVPVEEGPFDLIVCVDVIGYVTTPTCQRAGGRRGPPRGRGPARGVHRQDEFEGDVDHYRRRSPARYGRWFADAGLARVGPNLFVGPGSAVALSTFESPVDG